MISNLKSVLNYILIVALICILPGCDALMTEFKPVSTVIILDSSASNQGNIDKQKKFIKRLCAFMDPSDKVNILKTSETVYLIYQGKPNRPVPIGKALNAYTVVDKSEKGTAYGKAMRRAFQLSDQAIESGYIPAIITIGDLEDEYVEGGNINWESLPDTIKSIKEKDPTFTMAFFYAHPQRLDFIQQKLGPVLGEHLIIAPETSTNDSLRTFLEKIER